MYQQFNTNASQEKVNQVQNLINDIGHTNEYYKSLTNTISSQNKEITQKLKHNQDEFKNQLDTKPKSTKPNQASVPMIGEYLNWVQEVEEQMNGQMNEVKRKNEQITDAIINAHKLLEIYANRKQKAVRNTSRELYLIREIEELRLKVGIHQSKIEEHEQRLQFSEQITDHSENDRIIDFNEQSLELLVQMKTDYIKNKILLDKSKYYVEKFLLALNDGKKQ